MSSRDSGGGIFSTLWVCLCFIMTECGPGRPIITGTNTEAAQNILSICVFVTTVQDAVTKMYRCVAEIKCQADFKDGRGPSKTLMTATI